MDVCTVNFFSDSLGKYSSLNAFLPRTRGKARRRREYPVIYLLHGYSDDYSAWGRFARIERLVQKHNIAVVTPDGSTSFYINSALGRYEDHIIRDVIGFAETTFPVAATRGGRAIAGLSMGGFGALSLGMKYPQTFAAVCAHSSAIYPHERVASRPSWKPLAEDMARPANRLADLSKALLKKRRRPALRIDCGRDDFLYEENLRFRDHLEKIGLKHEFHVFDGAHTWDYWDEHIVESFAFIRKALH